MRQVPTAITSGAWLSAGALGTVLGSAVQLLQAQLWSPAAYGGLALAAALAWWVLARPRIAMRAGGPVGFIGLCAAFAFAATGMRAGVALADALPAELEGRDLRVVGVVAGLPLHSTEAWRFRFEVESAWRGDAAVALPKRLALGWYAERGARPAALPAVRAGQRWQLTLRLKRPHGSQNPWGYDRELQLFEQGVRATGYVRTARGSDNRLLAERAGHPVARTRQAVREAIELRVGPSGAGRDEAGVLAALVVGDQSAIDREDWHLYRTTGVAHLMSISGLHVTMFAWLAGLLTGWLWRRWPRAMLWLPAPTAARVGGLAAALAYAVFAGWGVPAQRTVLMLAVVTFVGGLGLRWPALAVWLAALVAVVLIDPWALLQAGFWLSFVAVGLLMLSDHGRGRAVRTSDGSDLGPQFGGPLGQRLRLAMQGGVRTQVVATLGLAPLSLVFFQQISVVGFVANLVAIPLVTMVITPLAMLGVLLPPLWVPAAWLVAALNAGLGALAAPAWVVWAVAAAPMWAVPAALLGVALALAPLPWRLRALALPLLLPLLMPATPRPTHGSFELIAVDVGQGTAVLVRTAGHALLYDAGPQYSREADAGERVLRPLLRSLGQPRLDVLMLSHRDSDHVGGATALLKGMGIGRLSSSLEAGHPLRALALQRGAVVEACMAGQRWEWDGVNFEVLHPQADRLVQAAAERAKPNSLSCVLRVSRAASNGDGPASVLLTGDLEREQELALVARHGIALKSELLLVPHHGSKTSSSAAFLDAVAPRVALVQAGYRNRFGHPAAEVMARYAERGIEVIESPGCGAWRSSELRPGASMASGCQRAHAPRYWQHAERVRGDNGVEVAISEPAPDVEAED